jgi:type III pantothenate kinase
MDALVLDIGNTRTKWGLFHNDALLHHGTVQSLDELTVWVDAYPNLKGIVVASGQWDPSKLVPGMTWHTVGSHSVVPFVNDYGAGEAVGADRLALAAAAVQLYPGQDVLVVALGTCITYNVITQSGSFLGGAITPGWNLRLKSMHDYTAGLPLLDPEVQMVWPGKTTAENMQSGVFLGLLAEVEGFVQNMRQQYPGAVVVFTGGDAEILKNHVKFPIFAPPGFLLTGANSILKLNLSE